MIKGLEGFIVGYLSILFERIFVKKRDKIIGIVVGILFGLLLYILGTKFYVGKAEIFLTLGGTFSLNLNFFRTYVGNIGGDSDYTDSRFILEKI